MDNHFPSCVMYRWGKFIYRKIALALPWTDPAHCHQMPWLLFITLHSTSSQRKFALKLYQGRRRWCTRNNFWIVRSIKLWNKFHRGFVELPFPGSISSRLDRIIHKYFSYIYIYICLNFVRADFQNIIWRTHSCTKKAFKVSSNLGI